MVVKVEPGGPADQAGVLLGDILLGIGNTPLEQTEDLQSFSGSGVIGKPVKAKLIRVLVKASSPIAKAGLESLLQSYPALRLVEGSSGDGRGMGGDSLPDVLLVEVVTLADPAAREAMDWAGVGGPVVMLVHNPANEAVAEALRGGVKAVFGSHRTGTEIAAAIGAEIISGTRG